MASRDVVFAIGVVLILTILFLPVPTYLIDIGLAVSISFSVLILMVALWIAKPLDFSSFPTILLMATLMRLSLNIATTRIILSDGHQGELAAGHVIGGFSRFVMSGDFVIGIVVFLILITVNFMVITKGATRIAEVGARFTLDAIPGKQMSIDADLSAGIIDDKEARTRRKELEEESSFFGSMDGASKFVRGDAIAGLIITAINIFGGIIIGVTRHGMSVNEAADVFTKLSVGDGLVSQIPALIVSLAAGLIVSKGGTIGSVDKAVLTQLGGHPRALLLAAGMMIVLAAMPGLPVFPFLLIAAVFGVVAYLKPLRDRQREEAEQKLLEESEAAEVQAKRDSVSSSLANAELELVLGKQLSATLLPSKQDLAARMNKMRKRFASELGFVVPEVALRDDLTIPPKTYQIRVHGTIVADAEARIGEVIVFADQAKLKGLPVTQTVEPAFGMKASSVPETFISDISNLGLEYADAKTVMLTHLSEVIRDSAPQLLSYSAMMSLIAGMGSDYRKLVEDTCTNHLSYPGLQAVLKLLLAERVSIRNLPFIVEAVAEIAPTVRKTELLVEHVRTRLASQLCADFSVNGTLYVLGLGSRWDLVVRESLKREANGEIIRFDIEPKLLEEFAVAVRDKVNELKALGKQFVIITTPEARPYVRMMVERLSPEIAVFSHLEIGRRVSVEVIGSVS
ncbi:MAG: flagellar biosynthesis protein FlhA [Pseudomonadota bacterium]